MKPGPFSYHRPGSVAEAVQLLGTMENAKVIAGGQSLMAMMNFRYAMPDHLIDLAGVPELQGIVVEDTRLHIGAMTRQRELEFSGALTDAAPAVRRGTPSRRSSADPQPRNDRWQPGACGSGRRVADRLPRLDAEIEIVGQAGSRQVPMREFVAGFMSTAVGYDESFWPPSTLHAGPQATDIPSRSMRGGMAILRSSAQRCC